jgi:hypothetical protein
VRLGSGSLDLPPGPGGGLNLRLVLPRRRPPLDITPANSVVHAAPQLPRGKDPRAEAMPEPQTLDLALVAEGHTIPVRPRCRPRTRGKRCAKARRESRRPVMRDRPADPLRAITRISYGGE